MTVRPSSQSPSVSRASVDDPVLRGPSDAVAAIPHLLGFVPERSLVAVWVADGRVVLTQRIDLPEPNAGATPAAASDLAAQLVRSAAAAGGDAVIVAVFHPDGPSAGQVAGADLVGHVLVEAVCRAAARAEVHVLDALLVVGDRFWSYRCVDGCCPGEGRIVEAAVRARIAGAFAGDPPLGQRAGLTSEIAPDVPVDPRIEMAIEELEADRAADIAASAERAQRDSLEHWRDLRISALLDALAADGPCGPAPASSAMGIARVLTGLADIRVRDTMVWHLAHGEGDAVARSVLAEALRAAPPGYVAPVATVLALLWWQRGDGARAAVALDRALDDDPDYRLAQLVAASIGSGLPPSAWREVMLAMPREQCRAPGEAEPGADAPGPPSRTADGPDPDVQESRASL